jgi:hypothetical protein
MPDRVRMIVRSGASTPTPKRLLEIAIVPMCQSPKIVDVLVHAKRLPANDNWPLAGASVKSFQARGLFAGVWLAFLALLCIGARLVAVKARRIL